MTGYMNDNMNAVNTDGDDLVDYPMDMEMEMDNNTDNHMNNNMNFADTNGDDFAVYHMDMGMGDQYG